MTNQQINEKVLGIKNLHLEQLNWNNKPVDKYVVTDGQEAYGFASKGYKPVSYAEALAKVQEWLPEGKVEHIYTEDGCSRAVLNIRLPKVFELDGSAVETHINLRNSLDGRWTLGAIVSPVLVVCKNTFVLSFQKAYIELEAKHRPNSVKKFFSEIRLVEQVYSALEGQLEIARKLQENKATTEQGRAFLQKLIDGNLIGKKVGEKAQEVFENPTFKNEEQRNLLGVFNATTNVLSRELEEKESITAYDKIVKVGEAFAEVVA